MILFGPFCDLRFLSRTFATTIEPLAFSSVKIKPYRSLKFSPQVQYLTAGDTPSSRWATKLIVDQGGRGHGDPSSLIDAGSTRSPKAEESYLIQSIGRLVNVKIAVYVPHLTFAPFAESVTRHI